jgi:uncharacterized protein (TIGR02145 family)
MNFITRQGRTLLLMAMVVVEAVCVSYGDNPSALVGQWVDMKNGKSVELFKDGTGVNGNTNITWKTEGKRFVLSEGSTSKVGDYNLSGYELTRIFDNGEVIVWVRKDKIEEYKNKKKEEAEQRVENISRYFTDPRDGQRYRAVKIGGKPWMAQNLNYQTGKSWCYANNNSNCEKYGRLYDWNTAKTACPTGWHLPSEKEWDNLVAAAGGKVAGKTLKSTYGWDKNGNGTDDFGFSALPSGPHNAVGIFGDVGNWWTATKFESGLGDGSIMFYIEADGQNDVWSINDETGKGGSVRCVKDN